MKVILQHYNFWVWGRPTRIQLLRDLVNLEAEDSEEDERGITAWLNGDYGDDSLSRVLRKSKRSRKKRRQRSPSIRREDTPEQGVSGQDVFDDETPNLRSLVACLTCAEDLAPRNFPKKGLTAECNHEPTVCKDCLTRSIDIQISDVDWDQVQCPECSAILPFEVVKKYASPELFKRCAITPWISVEDY